MSLRLRSLLVVAVCSLFGSCARERAALAVDMDVATASRFLAHGNCFAGWTLDLGLVVAEKQGVDVVIEDVTLRVDDDRTGKTLGSLTLNAAQLHDQFGGEALVRGHDALRIPIGLGGIAGTSERPDTSGVIVVSGEVAGHDEQGEAVRAPFRVSGGLAVNGGPLPSSGACPVP